MTTHKGIEVKKVFLKDAKGVKIEDNNFFKK